MQPVERISFDFEDNGTGHDDLVLRCGSTTWRCDSYYLALDRGILPDREDADKIRTVLKRLLGQWLDAICSLPERQIAYLPYDFSDQYTAWLQCRLSGDRVSVVRGWSPVEGWSFFPSQIGDYLFALPDFRADNDEFTIPLASLRGMLVQATQTN